MNEIFNLLASKVLDSVTHVKDWKSASLKIKRLEKNVGFESYYSDFADKLVEIDTTGDFQTSKAVHKLYEMTQSHPLQHSDWNRAIFTLYPDHKFSIEYIWDQDLHDRVCNNQ
ncbi:hypothetical protein [Chryseolinea soli]|uniref:Uncharacterized protein n=1 Tax=Chryseolinea soli TaxID=2321403 RepID=A0A385SXV7_9BACT|nr:hypothetical protein [Chryseolinea soli]AYB34885.1 hypothetical protein D4L85_31795 [Chryseolinea soli]